MRVACIKKPNAITIFFSSHGSQDYSSSLISPESTFASCWVFIISHVFNKGILTVC